RARVGIGASAVLAHLVLLRGPRQAGRAQIALLPEGAVADLLRSTPVGLLPRLQPSGAILPLPSELVGRLRRYGVHTLGHGARVGELALRRQFGERAGRLLAAMTRGGDVRAVTGTTAPSRLGLRGGVAGTPATHTELVRL